MQELTSTRWHRSGSSIVWAPELLAPLITGGDAVPMRTVLEWYHHGFPESPPADRKTVLVGGLQTVLGSFREVDAAYGWLRQNLLPLVRAFQEHWDRVGLVFGMDGPAKLFTCNEADDLVYFGKGNEKAAKVRLTLGIWNGAATGGGVYQLPVPESKEIGGYYVERVS
jgi:hypothetical protein